MKDKNNIDNILEKWDRIYPFYSCDKVTAVCLENEEKHLKTLSNNVFNQLNISPEEIMYECFYFIKNLELKNIFHFLPSLFLDNA